jgi:hypothetical protein
MNGIFEAYQHLVTCTLEATDPDKSASHDKWNADRDTMKKNLEERTPGYRDDTIFQRYFNTCYDVARIKYYNLDK